MSRRCLYCAKELPKTATNNFCSKECWTEYKKLKALDIGTDRQATVLLKRSELAEKEIQTVETGSDGDFQLNSHSLEAVVEESPEQHFSQSIFEDATIPASEQDIPNQQLDAVSSKKIETLTMRLAALENLLSGKSAIGDVDPSEPLIKQIDNLAIRLNKLEVDLDKVDAFLRSAGKYEDRIKRLERRLEDDPLQELTKKRGFFARLFS